MTLERKDADSVLKTHAELNQRLNRDRIVNENILKEAKISEDKIAKIPLLLTQQLSTWQTWWIAVDKVVELDKIYSLVAQIGKRN